MTVPSNFKQHDEGVKKMRATSVSKRRKFFTGGGPILVFQARPITILLRDKDIFGSTPLRNASAAGRNRRTLLAEGYITLVCTMIAKLLIKSFHTQVAG